MVCNRCITLLKQEFIKVGLTVESIVLGEIVYVEKEGVDQYFIENMLRNNGFELVKDAVEMIIEHLKIALEVRSKYGIFESHDTLQQLMNLTNMLILSKDYDLANQALSLYESLVLEHEGENSRFYYERVYSVC